MDRKTWSTMSKDELEELWWTYRDRAVYAIKHDNDGDRLVCEDNMKHIDKLLKRDNSTWEGQDDSR